MNLRQAAAWTWFHDPRAIFHAGRTFVTWHERDGIYVGAYDDNQLTWSTFRLAPSVPNDHNVASLGIRSDGRLLACYSDHNHPLHRRVSTEPGSVQAWESTEVIDVGRCTYPTLSRLADEGRWYLFYRRVYDRSHMQMLLRTSDDEGESWSEATLVFNVPGHRPYFKVASDGRSRIDIAITDGHPNEFSQNSIYHFAYEGGAWRDSLGSPIGMLPLGPDSVTRVHDGVAGDSAWVWDISPGPVIAFATFPAIDDHRYHRAEWADGWKTIEVQRAGTSLDPDGSELYYSGGIAIDHARPDLMYASVKDRNGWSIIRLSFIGAETVATTESIRVAESGERNIRPTVVRGDHRVMWISGRYEGYRRFDTQLSSHPPLRVVGDARQREG
jgi:hypothetical protein